MPMHPPGIERLHGHWSKDGRVCRQVNCLPLSVRVAEGHGVDLDRWIGTFWSLLAGSRISATAVFLMRLGSTA